MAADAAADFAAGAFVEFGVNNTFACGLAAAINGESVRAGGGVGLLGEVGDEFGHHAANGRQHIAALIRAEQAAVKL